MFDAIVFYTLAAMILGLGILVISVHSAVHSVLFLVVNFLFVAILYVTLSAEFVAVIQVLVYAGGIVVLYLFVVMLVSLKQAPEQYKDQRRLSTIGVLLSAVVFLEVVGIAVYTSTVTSETVSTSVKLTDFPPRIQGLGFNTEQIGWVLYTEYLIPFEVASMLLLVAMIGAIVLAKRDI